MTGSTLPRLAAACLLALGAATHAQATDAASPTGLWRIIDDKSGEPTALIRLAADGDTLTGRLEKILPKKAVVADPANKGKSAEQLSAELGAKPCEMCQGALAGKPVGTLPILTGLKRAEGAEPVWSGGQILDPQSGKSYRAKITLSADGKTLDVRGYIGTPMFGRSQVWKREGS